MNLQKDQAVLRQLTGFNEEQCLQWFERHHGLTRNEAIRQLAVARGKIAPSDIRVISPSHEN